MSWASIDTIRREIARSASFRLTLRFAAGVVFCLLAVDFAVGLLSLWWVQHKSATRIEAALADTRLAYADGGAAAVAHHASGARKIGPDSVLVGLTSVEGELLVGWPGLPKPVEEGWSDYVPAGFGADEALWVKAEQLDDGAWVSAAMSSETYHDVAELMWAGAAWSIAVGLPLALASGALLSRAVLRRLAPIVETAGKIREGDLKQRAPVLGRDDEFDDLAGSINAMLDRIESLNRNLRNVTVGIAHELRTPLTRVRNQLAGIGGDPGHHTAAVDKAQAEIDATLATFDALLRIGQIETNAERQRFVPVDLSDLACGLAELYEPVAAEQGKRLSAAVAPGVTVRGNRELLTQMLSNLLENAIEHTPEGTAIDLALSRDAEHAVMVVADNGPGIPEGEQARIFERFYRLDRSRSQPGNGLGLSLVQSICGLHGFSVSLDPAAKGARFVVSM